MDLILLLLLSALSLFSIFFFFEKSMLLLRENKKRMAPMAPGAWPLVGHLAYFKNSVPTHVIFGDMAEVLGPVFMTKMGSYNVLIISSEEVTKECFTIHDKVIDRVPLTASKLLSYNRSFMSFAPYGAYWQELRKIASSELFSTTTIDKLKDTRAREVDMMFKDFYVRWEQEGGSKNGVLVDMKCEFQDLASNISLMMIAGKRYFGSSPNCEAGEARRCGKLTKELFHYFGLDLFSDVIPSLGWSEWKIKRGMKRTAKELDKVLEAWIEEHKQRRRDHNASFEKDYLDLLIEIFENRKISDPSRDAHTTTKALCLNMVFSGSEPVIVVLVWAVSLLVNNPHVLRKAQEELDKKIGRDKVVDESDIKDLVYLNAIVKETFRLYPPLPLVAFRYVVEDFDIGKENFHLPAGTLILVNEWKIQRDPNLWSDPELFDPERFLTSQKEGNVIGTSNYKLFPFGLGRRGCPAIPLGMRMVHYILARFLHSFDLATPLGQDVDMTESSGFVNIRATPLQVLINPRLHQSLYQVDRSI